MKRQLKRWGTILLGWFLILVGLVLAIPGVPGPGLLIVFVGLTVLAAEVVWAHNLLQRLYRRWPKLEQYAERSRHWAHRLFHRGSADQ